MFGAKGNTVLLAYVQMQIFFLGDVKVLSSEKSPLVMKDVKWYTHNCTVGYMVSG